MMRHTPTALEIQGLDVRYGAIHAVRSVSLSMAPGTTVALIGANGAGKSSVMKALSGLIPLAAGQIRFEGSALGRLSAPSIVRRGVVQVPEGRQVFGGLTVAENLLLGGFHLSARERQAGYERVYALFGRLRERAGQLAGLLSGGEQQMLAIGRALMAQPRLLLLDEPSMGLAPNLANEIFAVIRALRQQDTTILLVEQNARRALDTADYAYVMEVGRIVAEGPPAELRHSPVLARAYLGGH